MPNTTPNLGLTLSGYDDQEHHEYNANWGILDKAAYLLLTIVQLENINTPQTLSLVAPSLDTFYSCPIYINSRGGGASPSSLILTLSWTGVSGSIHTTTMSIDGTQNGQVAQEVFVLLAKAGTSVTITTAFSTTPFYYDIAAKISLA